ncbi:MAG: cyclase family protein, partial [Cyclobacteriaceae bacterium]|nr:cyclase family protein [Cyclobacteriaceae bacterium]
KGMPPVSVTVHRTHEGTEGIPAKAGVGVPMVNYLQLAEHTGTHVDALSHMSPDNAGQTIETMPLSLFYTEGICLDLSDKGLGELIEAGDLQRACDKAGEQIRERDTVLLYTDHYRKHFLDKDWINGPGLSEEAARWLGLKKIAAFGVETMSPGISGVSNRQVHAICGELGFTHYENLVNLQLLVGRGRFRFVGFPLRIRGGTGSPVRAVAIFN